MLPDFFHKTFIFGKNSFIKTTLVDEHTGEPVYEIQSSFSVQSTKTRVIRNSSDVVIITRREWPRSDSIAFQGHTEVKMKKWLNDNSFRDPFVFHVHRKLEHGWPGSKNNCRQNISDTTAVRYIWKNEKFGELTVRSFSFPEKSNFKLRPIVPYLAVPYGHARW